MEKNLRMLGKPDESANGPQRSEAGKAEHFPLPHRNQPLQSLLLFAQEATALLFSSAIGVASLDGYLRSSKGLLQWDPCQAP